MEIKSYSEDPVYAAAENNLKNKVEQYAAGSHTNPDAPPARLQVSHVAITGAPRECSFVERVRGGVNGDSCERLDIAVVFSDQSDLRALNEKQVRNATKTALKDAFDAITLPNGGKLSDSMDFSGKTPEAAKPIKEQIADVQRQVEAGIAEANGAVPPEAAALLRHAKTFDTEAGSVFGFATGTPDVRHGHVEINFAISNKGEGDKTNSAVVKDNLEARKDEVLTAIRDAAIAGHAAHSTSPEDMAKFTADVARLDFKTELTQDGVKFLLGNKPEEQGQHRAEDNRLGKTVLAELSEPNLERIVNNSLLFKGKDAEQVAHLIAGDSDIRRIMNDYKDQAPSFAEALKSEVIKNTLPWDEYAKAQSTPDASAKVQPVVNINTSFNDGVQHNELHIAIDLPKDVTHSDVVRALAGKAMTQEVVGKATANLAEGRAAANDGLAQRSA